MNSTFVTISILVKSDISKKCLINSLMNMSNEALEGYLKLARIYESNSSKKKTDLIEMIVYRHINNKINKKCITDISHVDVDKILKEHGINIKSLPEHGNVGLKRKEILENVYNEKSSINIQKE